MKQLIIFTLLIALFSTGCREEDNSPTAGSPDPTSSDFVNPFLSGSNVSADFVGRITDENGNPIPNAFVNIGSKFSTTNEHGFYKISNVSVDRSFALIKVLAANHFHQFRNLKPRTSQDNVVDIRMIPRMYDQNFEAADGGTVQIANGGSVVFEPNSIVDENGNSYSGQVSIASTYLDPTDMTLSSYMPGSIAAVDAEGNGVAMITYGMIGVEMVGNNGRPLQIAPDRTAQISFPVAESQMSHAPDLMPLWYFDENAGIWHEEASATKNGNTYNAEVSHFSFWNCDIPVPFITLQGSLNCESFDGSSLYVNLERPNGSSANGYVGANGYFSGFVPANEELIMNVYTSSCGFQSSLFTTTIGPFSADTDLGSIDLECQTTFESPHFTGSVVDCDGAPIEGIAVMYEPSVGPGHYALTGADGTFEFTTYCLDEGTLTYTLVDLDNLLEAIGDEVTVDASVNLAYDLGALPFCETTTIDNYLTYEEGDNLFSFPFLQFTDTTECTGLQAYLSPTTFQNHMMNMYFETLEAPGTTDVCSEGAYIGYELSDGVFYTGYIGTYEVVITDVIYDGDTYTLVAGTYTGSAEVNIIEDGVSIDSYTATASGSFHFEP